MSLLKIFNVGVGSPVLLPISYNQSFIHEYLLGLNAGKVIRIIMSIKILINNKIKRAYWEA